MSKNRSPTDANRIISCEECPVGHASGAGHGGFCPFIDRARNEGELIFGKGEQAEYVWFVKSGTVALEDDAGRVRAVRFAGSFIGLEALISSDYLDTARSLSKVVLCGATSGGIETWLGAKGSPARTALELTLRAAYRDSSRLAGPGGSVVQRLADWLRSESPSGVALDLPRRVIADLLGIRAETLSRAIADLRDRGAIEATRSQLTVRDPALLATIADGG